MQNFYIDKLYNYRLENIINRKVYWRVVSYDEFDNLIGVSKVNFVNILDHYTYIEKNNGNILIGLIEKINKDEIQFRRKIDHLLLKIKRKDIKLITNEKKF